jgi:hypothetical protein
MRLQIVERPFSRSITLFAPAAELKQHVVSHNKIRFIVRHETKTHLSLSVVGGAASFKVNEESDYSRQVGLKFVTKTDWNYFSGRQSVNHYFKLNKKQNMDILFNHIESLTRGLILRDSHIEDQVDKNTFMIEVELPDDLLELSPLKIGDTQLCEVGM